MQKEYEIVIADTSCFILLEKIGELELLRILFGKVSTTTIIAAEFGAQLPIWVEIKSVKNIPFQNSLDIDAGEASAIALAMESETSLIILDDNKGRKAARRFNLKVTGTLGLLLKAKRDGFISSILPLLQKIQQTNFRYSESVLQEILFLAEEDDH